MTAGWWPDEVTEPAQPTPEQALGHEVHEAAVERARRLIAERATAEGLDLPAPDSVEALLVELGVAAGIVGAWVEVRERGMLVPPPAPA